MGLNTFDIRPGCPASDGQGLSQNLEQWKRLIQQGFDENARSGGAPVKAATNPKSDEGASLSIPSIASECML
jgi:hypothetical protein